ncbi:MAG TPA: class I SAM-dependent methyltransferase, partial [Jatrophihabitantaceae bacterium]|nr:class I SAM-dependent methyltransferase [Jatrophihabitantaceae bacterium]
MDAAGWDDRYRSSELVWGIRPNRWVEQELAGLPVGSALDVACGEGRNALWLASLGWQVTAVDFSPVALEKGRALEERALADRTGAIPVSWRCADATTYRHDAEVDVALLCYLQLPAEQRRAAVRNAAAALAPGGTLLVIGHDSTNLADGTGGPQDLSVLFTADDIASDLDGTDLKINRADAVLRPVEGAPR